MDSYIKVILFRCYLYFQTFKEKGISCLVFLSTAKVGKKRARMLLWTDIFVPAPDEVSYLCSILRGGVPQPHLEPHLLNQSQGSAAYKLTTCQLTS